MWMIPFSDYVLLACAGVTGKGYGEQEHGRKNGERFIITSNGNDVSPTL